MADAMLWITMATVLATCKISKVVNEDGEEITPVTEYTGGTMWYVTRLPPTDKDVNRHLEPVNLLVFRTRLSRFRTPPAIFCKKLPIPRARHEGGI